VTHQVIGDRSGKTAIHPGLTWYVSGSDRGFPAFGLARNRVEVRGDVLRREPGARLNGPGRIVAAKTRESRPNEDRQVGHFVRQQMLVQDRGEWIVTCSYAADVIRADCARNWVASPGLGCSMLNKDLFQLRPDVISKPLLIVSDVERDSNHGHASSSTCSGSISGEVPSAGRSEMASTQRHAGIGCDWLFIVRVEHERRAREISLARLSHVVIQTSLRETTSRCR